MYEEDCAGDRLMESTQLLNAAHISGNAIQIGNAMSVMGTCLLG